MLCEQPKICDEKWKIINNHIDEIRKYVNDFDDLAKVLVELKTIVQQIREDAIKRDEVIKELFDNIKVLNNTQVKVGITLENLTDRMVTVEEKVDRNSLSIPDLIKNLIYVAVGAGGTIGITKLLGG